MHGDPLRDLQAEYGDQVDEDERALDKALKAHMGQVAAVEEMSIEEQISGLPLHLLGCHNVPDQEPLPG